MQLQATQSQGICSAIKRPRENRRDWGLKSNEGRCFAKHLTLPNQKIESEVTCCGLSRTLIESGLLMIHYLSEGDLTSFTPIKEMYINQMNTSGSSVQLQNLNVPVCAQLFCNYLVTRITFDVRSPDMGRQHRWNTYKTPIHIKRTPHHSAEKSALLLRSLWKRRSLELLVVQPRRELWLTLFTCVTPPYLEVLPTTCVGNTPWMSRPSLCVKNQNQNLHKTSTLTLNAHILDKKVHVFAVGSDGTQDEVIIVRHTGVKGSALTLRSPSQSQKEFHGRDSRTLAPTQVSGSKPFKVGCWSQKSKRTSVLLLDYSSALHFPCEEISCFCPRIFMFLFTSGHGLSMHRGETAPSLPHAEEPRTEQRTTSP